MDNEIYENPVSKKEEVERFSRHILIPEIGLEGQKKLHDASVLIVGAGGLGGVQAMYLTAAGIGRLGVVDHDSVELSNLQRQIAFNTKDLGRKKLEALEENLKCINPDTQLEMHNTKLHADNAMQICSGYDIVIDGSDNFATRYLINDVCVFLKKPNMYGSVSRFEGQVSVFDAERGPCYRCLYPAAPAPDAIDNCEIGGILGVLPGIIGLMQSVETIKYILGLGESLSGRLVVYDALSAQFNTVRLKKDPGCPVCSATPTITEPIDYEAFCGRGEYDTVPEAWEISSGNLKKLLESKSKIRLVDIRESQEKRICRISPAENIVLRDLRQELSHVEKDAPIILFCRAGIRSAHAVHMLRGEGFTNVMNLRGGILAWIEEIEPHQAKY